MKVVLNKSIQEFDMSCEYGCPTDSVDDKCANCGHPKGDHSTIHPHCCQGEYDKERIHVVKSCRCMSFTRSPVNAGTGI